jgi:septal ring factor EnvC (AmiA/AmiB activator)
MAMRDAAGLLQHLVPTCLLCGCAATFDPMAGQSPESYCTFDNGYRIGADGSDYAALCPDLLAPAFVDGYQAGYTIHLAQLEVEALERAIQAVSDDLQRSWRASAEVGARLADLAEDSAQGHHLRAEASALTVQQDRLRRQLDELEADVAARKQQLLSQRHFLAGTN